MFKYVLPVLILLLSGIVNAAPYKELIPNFNRVKSPVMIRKVDLPTRANLDYAAYIDNPIRYDPEKFKPQKPRKSKTISDMNFNGRLLSPVHSLAKTPLTQEEKDNPVAWIPLQNLLWSELKTDDLKKIGSAINGYKWSDSNIYKPYQEVVAAYIHATETGYEIWVEVEFSSWVNFLSGITDSDNDGFLEIYGKLQCESVDKETLNKVVAWIRDTYQKEILTEEQVVDWITVLASYWYPTLNTDLVDMSNQSRWPNENTEKKIRKRLKKIYVDNPIAVVRGNPHGKTLYNVFLVSGMGERSEEQEAETVDVKKEMDTRVSKNFTGNMERFQRELAAHGNAYGAWVQSCSTQINIQKKILEELPAGQMGFKGVDDWVFFRKSLEYTTAGDLSLQPTDKNPLTHLIDFKKFCDQNSINLLFIAVPTKAEIYYEKVGIEPPESKDDIIHPYGRKILADLQKAGIEVIDLLPRFLAARKDDTDSTGEVYQRQDTHWTNRGLQIAAGLIADRIKEYAWYRELSSQKRQYTMRDTTFTRMGDIIARLPESQQTDYQPVVLQAQQVLRKDGSRYKGNRHDPILLIGDSFTGVFELVDCKSAGIGAHIAAKTGLGVDIITSWGGGPLVRNKMLRARKNDLGAKRLIIYMMVARDLYNYSQGWEKLKTE